MQPAAPRLLMAAAVALDLLTTAAGLALMGVEAERGPLARAAMGLLGGAWPLYWALVALVVAQLYNLLVRLGGLGRLQAALAACSGPLAAGLHNLVVLARVVAGG